jgi:hypothetical protein
LGSGVFAGDVVEAMCSGVWGIDDQGSFRLTDDVERRSLGRNAGVRETKWCRKIDMVCFWMMTRREILWL